MKKILVFCAICAFIIFSSCEQHTKIAASEVPQSVMTAFNAKYQGATDVEWMTEKKDNKTVYEAEFKLNDKKKEAEFDANGNFIEEE
jgi:uncharacterized membrane protein YkoI